MSRDLTISSDKRKLDIPAIHRFLSERSYWAKGRALETVQKAIDHSLCFGVYDEDEQILGFGRVVTDHAVFANIMDVFILEEHRGQGLAKKLIAHIMNVPELANIKRWQLVTSDAYGLYERFGFAALAQPHKHMEKIDPQRP